MHEESILDASAFLSFLLNESGEEVVSRAVDAGAVMSAVNLTESLAVLSGHGADPAGLVKSWIENGLLHGAILIEELTLDDAVEAARLRPLTRHLGLSLADRACLALAMRLEFPVLTADRAWARIDLPVEIRLIR